MEGIIINNPANCCGCRSCENICPKNAITMIENSEGFLYPHIDEKKCIKCGLCRKVCPLLNNINRDDFFDKPVCYAAKSLDTNMQIKSSSGGMFGLIAKFVLDNSGVVFGSEMDENHNVKHTMIANIDDLNKLMGSKYVYSDLNNVFLQVRKELNNGKLVLFSGVPCQISALSTFLQKKYENLITVEVICHGAPSQKLFDKYIKYLENKYKSTLLEYCFRDKRAAKWGTFKAYAVFKNKKGKKFCKKINADFDPYYFSFLKCKNYRESCYECKFANSKRNSDFTIGDFWGIEKIKPKFVDYKGVSVLIINSNKGLKVFDLIKNNIKYDLVDYDDISVFNGQLSNPSKRPFDRNKWYDNFDNDDFIKKIKVTNKFKSFIKILFPQSIKFKIKKLISK